MTIEPCEAQRAPPGDKLLVLTKDLTACKAGLAVATEHCEPVKSDRMNAEDKSWSFYFDAYRMIVPTVLSCIVSADSSLWVHCTFIYIFIHIFLMCKVMPLLFGVNVENQTGGSNSVHYEVLEDSTQHSSDFIQESDKIEIEKLEKLKRKCEDTKKMELMKVGFNWYFFFCVYSFFVPPFLFYLVANCPRWTTWLILGYNYCFYMILIKAMFSFYNAEVEKQANINRKKDVSICPDSLFLSEAYFDSQGYPCIKNLLEAAQSLVGDMNLRDRRVYSNFIGPVFTLPRDINPISQLTYVELSDYKFVPDIVSSMNVDMENVSIFYLLVCNFFESNFHALRSVWFAILKDCCILGSTSNRGVEMVKDLRSKRKRCKLEGCNLTKLKALCLMVAAQFSCAEAATVTSKSSNWFTLILGCIFILYKGITHVISNRAYYRKQKKKLDEAFEEAKTAASSIFVDVEKQSNLGGPIPQMSGFGALALYPGPSSIGGSDLLSFVGSCVKTCLPTVLFLIQMKNISESKAVNAKRLMFLNVSQWAASHPDLWCYLASHVFNIEQQTGEEADDDAKHSITEGFFGAWKTHKTLGSSSLPKKVSRFIVHTVCGSIFGTEKDSDITRTVAETLTSITSVSKSFDNIGDIIFSVYRSYGVYQVTNDLDEAVNALDDSVMGEKVYLALFQVNESMTKGTLGTDYPDLTVVNDLFEKFASEDSARRSHVKGFERTTMNERIKEVQRWYEKYCLYLQENMPKPKPFTVLIYGTGQIGKSSCSSEVLRGLHGDERCNITTTNGMIEWDDPLTTEKTGCVIEDMGVSKNEDLDLMAMFVRLCNSIVTILSYADANKMGKHLNMMKRIVVNSNQCDAGLMAWANDPDAVDKRFEVKVHARELKNIRDKQGKFDASKIEPQQKGCFNTTCEYATYDIVVPNNSSVPMMQLTSRYMSWKEMTQLVIAKSKEHDQREAVRLERLAVPYNCCKECSYPLAACVCVEHQGGFKMVLTDPIEKATHQGNLEEWERTNAIDRYKRLCNQTRLVGPDDPRSSSCEFPAVTGKDGKVINHDPQPWLSAKGKYGPSTKTDGFVGKKTWLYYWGIILLIFRPVRWLAKHLNIYHDEALIHVCMNNALQQGFMGFLGVSLRTRRLLKDKNKLSFADLVCLFYIRKACCMSWFYERFYWFMCVDWKASNEYMENLYDLVAHSGMAATLFSVIVGGPVTPVVGFFFITSQCIRVGKNFDRFQQRFKRVMVLPSSTRMEAEMAGWTTLYSYCLFRKSWWFNAMCGSAFVGGLGAYSFWRYKRSLKPLVETALQIRTLDEKKQLAEQTKPWAKQVIKIPKTNIQSRTGLDDKNADKVKNNFFRLYKTSNDTKHVLFGVFLCTDVILLVSHLWEELEGDSVELYMEAPFLNGKRKKMRIQKESSYIIPGKDAMVCRITGWGSRPNICPLFRQEGTYSGHLQGSIITMESENVVEKDVWFTTSPDMTSSMDGDVLLTTVDGKKGDCGRMLTSTSGGFSVCGIHYAGEKSGGSSFFVPLSSSNLKKAISKLRAKSPLLSPLGQIENHLYSSDCEKLSMTPHKNSFLKFIPDDEEVGVVSTGEQTFAKTYKSNCQLNASIADSINLFPDPGPIRRPAMKYFNDARRLCIISGSYQKEPDDHVVMSVLEEMWNEIRPVLEKDKAERRTLERFLTMDEVINGVTGDPSLNGLNMSTSAGAPFNTKKRKIFEGEPGSYRMSAKMLEEFTCAEAMVLCGFKTGGLYTGSPKDEVLAAEKGEKTRIFFGTPLFDLCITMKYLSGMMKWCLSNNELLGHAIGINPFGEDWDALMAPVLKEGYGYDCDYSSYDMTALKNVTSASAKLLARIANCMIPRGEDFYERVLDMAVNPELNLFGKVVTLPHIYPSGTWITALLNGLRNIMMKRVSFKIQEPNLSYRDHNWDVTLGDDLLCTCSDTTSWNLNVFAKHIEEWGGKLTDGQKGNDITKRPVDEIPFLKRRICWHPDLKRHIGLLDIKSVVRPLFAGIPSEDLSFKDNQIAICRSVLTELVGYGRSSFDEGQRRVLEWLKRSGCVPSPDIEETYDERIEHLCPTEEESEALAKSVEECCIDWPQEKEVDSLYLQKMFRSSGVEFQMDNTPIVEEEEPEVTSENAVNTDAPIVQDQISGSIGDSFYRMIPLTSFEIPVGAYVTRSFRPYEMYLNDPFIKSRLKFMSKARMGLNLKFFISGSKAHFGELLVSVRYMPEHQFKLRESEAGLVNLATLCLASQRPHVTVRVGDQEGSSILHVPWLWFTPDMLLESTEKFRPIVAIDIETVAPVRHIHGQPGSVHLRVFCQADNPQVTGTTSYELQTNTGEPPISSTLDHVSDIFHHVAQVSSSFPRMAVPAEIGSNLTGSLAGLARAAGYSQPVSLEGQNMVRHLTSPLVTCNQHVHGRQLAIDARHGVTFDGRANCDLDTDPMDFFNICARRTIVRVTTWSVNTRAGEELASIPVSPVMVISSGNKFVLSPSALISAFHRYWCGTIHYSVTVIAPPNAGGKLAVYSETLDSVDQSISTNVSVTLDLSETDTISFPVHWQSDKPVLPCNWVLQNYRDRDWTNGRIIIRSLTDLYAPGQIEVECSVVVRMWIERGDMYWIVHENSFSKSINFAAAAEVDDTSVPIYPPFGRRRSSPPTGRRPITIPTFPFTEENIGPPTDSEPSGEPTASPQEEPTLAPATSSPTGKPVIETLEPTLDPTVQASLTKTPTMAPTRSATDAPTDQQSLAPTLRCEAEVKSVPPLLIEGLEPKKQGTFFNLDPVGALNVGDHQIQIPYFRGIQSNEVSQNKILITTKGTATFSEGVANGQVLELSPPVQNPGWYKLTVVVNVTSPLTITKFETPFPVGLEPKLVMTPGEGKITTSFGEEFSTTVFGVGVQTTVEWPFPNTQCSTIPVTNFVGQGTFRFAGRMEEREDFQSYTYFYPNGIYDKSGFITNWPTEFQYMCRMEFFNKYETQVEMGRPADIPNIARVLGGERITSLRSLAMVPHLRIEDTMIGGREVVQDHFNFGNYKDFQIHNVIKYSFAAIAGSVRANYYLLNDGALLIASMLESSQSDIFDVPHELLDTRANPCIDVIHPYYSGGQFSVCDRSREHDAQFHMKRRFKYLSRTPGERSRLHIRLAFTEDLRVAMFMGCPPLELD